MGRRGLWAPAEEEQVEALCGEWFVRRYCGSSGAEVTRRQQLALIAHEGKSEDKGKCKCQFTGQGRGP